MKDLLAFVTTRSMEGDFGRFASDVGEQSSYVVAIELLSWLKRQKKFGHEKPLDMNPNYTWCRLLPILLAADTSLSSLFELVDGQLQFKVNIPREERDRIREVADAGYRPELKT